MSQFGFQQLINEPNFILNETSRCIDLIFKNRLNLTTESAVHSSLHSHYDHQIVSAKFNMKTYLKCCV